jgi:hypothetical protein
VGWFSGKTFGVLAALGPIPAMMSVQHDAQKEQAAALRSMHDEDARKAAEAETGAAVAANAQIAESKRRRRSSALGLGDDSATDTLGAPTGALAGGASAASRSLAAYYSGGTSYGGTALGAGASVSSGPRLSYGGGGGRAPTSSKVV